MVSRLFLQIVTIVIGISLILEGIGSLIAFDDQSDLFQAGRIFRVISGFIIVFVISRRIK